MAFRRWLKAHKPDAFERLFPEGKLNYARSTGEEMPRQIAEWRQSTE